MKKKKERNRVPGAMKIIGDVMKKDSGYRYAWTSSLARAIVDELEHAGYRFPGLLKLANEVADKFIAETFEK
jgi:hypothetical protein